MHLIGQLSVTAFCVWMAKDAIYAFRQGWWGIGGLLTAFLLSVLVLIWLP